MKKFCDNFLLWHFKMHKKVNKNTTWNCSWTKINLQVLTANFWFYAMFFVWRFNFLSQRKLRVLNFSWPKKGRRLNVRLNVQIRWTITENMKNYWVRSVKQWRREFFHDISMNIFDVKCMWRANGDEREKGDELGVQIWNLKKNF